MAGRTRRRAAIPTLRNLRYVMRAATDRYRTLSAIAADGWGYVPEASLNPSLDPTWQPSSACAETRDMGGCHMKTILGPSHVTSSAGTPPGALIDVPDVC